MHVNFASNAPFNEKPQLNLNLMAEHLGKDGFVNDGFGCHPTCLMMLSCVMMTMWFVGIVSDPSMWKITIALILKSFGLMNLNFKI